MNAPGVRAARTAVLLACTLIPLQQVRTTGEDLRFTRVHLPEGGLTGLPIGDERHVPMPRQEFEAAVARSSGHAPEATPPFTPRADAARYEATVSADGRVAGRVEFDLGVAVAAGTPLPLGGLGAPRVTARTDAGVGDAPVICRADGSLAIVSAGAGSYAAEWTAPPATSTAEAMRFAIPLIPAVRSTVHLVLPEGRRPLPVGYEVPAVRDGAAWVIEAGPRAMLEFLLVAAGGPAPQVASWSTVDVSGREVAVEVSLTPVFGWGDEPVVLEKDPALVATRVSLAAGEPRDVSWSVAADSRSITCRLPAVAVGRRDPLVVRAVGPLPDGTARPLPTLRARAAEWAGGGTMVRVGPEFALASLDLRRCLAVTPEAAAAWPVPGGAGRDREERVADRVLPARLYVEHQEPRAEIRIAVLPRTPQLDGERATVVEFTPGGVVGVATFDVGVLRGEAFDLEGPVAPGWFIDTVDIAGWSGPFAGADAGVADSGATQPPDWKVVRGAAGDVLRLGLSTAITPGKRLRLRVAGHRAGVAPGTVVTAADTDFVQLGSMATEAAAIGLKTSADLAVEIEGAAGGQIDPRLASLVGDQGVRAWLSAGGRADGWQARIVRRRPPLDVQTQVRLTARDDRLSQSFTFECRPDTSDLDGLVVRFSEPMDDPLEWSLLAPASGAIVARRLESAAESWVVEFTPPVRESATIRAVRTVPFKAAVPIPLAWVEGAARQMGEVFVRDAGRRQPRIVNRRLAELPPRSAGVDRWPTLLGAFSFVGDRDAAGPAAAELVPGGSDDEAARAWAWRETTACWCHASGRTEFETSFEIETLGRTVVMVGLPAGRVLQGIEIDGARVAIPPHEDLATVPIDLPVGRSTIMLTVRTVATDGAAGDWWRVEPGGVTVDLPVLDRVYRMLVPPDLEIVDVSSAWRRVGHDDAGVVGRLVLGGTPAVAADAPAPAAGRVGAAFRTWEFIPAGRSDRGAILVIRSRWLGIAAVVCAALVGWVAIALVPRRPWLAPVFCMLAGVAALWLPAPLDVVARAGWWAALAVLFATGGRWFAAGVPLVCCGWCAAALAPSGVACAADPVSVVIVPATDGETALVPESLYRILARTDAGQTAAIRIVSSRLVAPAVAPAAGTDERWRLSLELDATAAGTTTLGPQERADGWVGESLRIDGELVAPGGGRPPDEILITRSGRHRIDVDVRPRLDSRGDVDILTVALPPAPTAELEFDGRGTAGAGGCRCEVATSGSAFIAADEIRRGDARGVAHDLSRADRVRLVRPRGGMTLASGSPVVVSRNAVAWELDACRVEASFVIESGNSIAAPCVVQADPGLELVEPVDPAIDVIRLSARRFIVRASEPVAGPFAFRLAWRMPLAVPVGSFVVPAAWIESASLDQRTTTITAAGDLGVEVSAPPPFLPAAADGTGGGGAAWRVDVRAAGDRQRDTDPAGGDARARITVERRRQEIRGTQAVRVRFGTERTRIDLEARFDAASAPLVSLPIELPVAAVVDSIALFPDGLQDPDALERGPVEAHWSRTTPERGVLTVQRPQAGRFRLEVATHVPRPPGATGRLPMVRAAVPATPTVVSWNETVDAPDADRSWEVRDDERAPLYALRREGAIEPPEVNVEPQAVPAAQADTNPRIELADVELTLEGRGRAWGRARFDVIVRQRLLRLALPPGMRLFDVLVDGQPIASVAPVAAGGPGERWDIRLHDAGWPRSIEVIYAGTIGGGADDGPVEIEPPMLLGLPCVRRLWTLRPPRDAVVHVAEPGRVAPVTEVRKERAAALAKIGIVFEKIIASSTVPEREHLRQEYETRTRGFEEEIHGFAATAARSDDAVHVIDAGGDVPLAIRIARRRDPALLAKAWATSLILAVGGALWVGTRRRLST